jgi:hypothetical protein
MFPAVEGAGMWNPEALHRAGLRFSAAVTGGALGGLLAAGLSYWLCGLLLERHTGVVGAFWPGMVWLERCIAWGAFGGLVVLAARPGRRTLFKALLLALLPGVLMYTGLLPALPMEPSPLADAGLELTVVSAASATWGLTACWWMKLCLRGR